MISRDVPPSFASLPDPQSASIAESSLSAGLTRAQQKLLSIQAADGHWCGELEGDSILESEYILLLAYLGRTGDPKVGKCARSILSRQNPDGGWSNHPGGPAEVSCTAKAYFALKIAGYDPADERLQKAKDCVHRLGGAEAVNSFTRFYFAALSQIPYSSCPSTPPELVRLPKWFPLNIYRMSSWTRAILVPLSLVQVHQPKKQLPPEMSIAELFRQPESRRGRPACDRFQGRIFSWANFFRLTDRVIKVAERVVPLRMRARSIEAAKKWMLDHFEGSDGVGAIFPPMIYTVMALDCLGYAEDSPEFKWAEKQLTDLMIEENDSIRLQPCVSPVWDTAIAVIALADSNASLAAPAAEVQVAVDRAVKWLLQREIREPGDWSVLHPHVPPSGWAFEYRNRFYPDLDDTAMVLIALAKADTLRDTRVQPIIERATKFLLGLRSSDGGWAAFDKDVNNRVLEAVPFADHNAMLDPTCPDITARVLEAFAELDCRREDPVVEKAVKYILSNQEPEGCWYGRWGVNYIYGTWQALLGLSAAGYDLEHPRIRRAVQWLESVQQASGGWGESAASYDDRKQMGVGPETPSQTAWAVMGLIAAGNAESEACRRGVEFLLQTQKADGDWEEQWFTGTGFPKVFYLRYHLYRLYFHCSHWVDTDQRSRLDCLATGQHPLSYPCRGSHDACPVANGS